MSAIKDFWEGFKSDPMNGLVTMQSQRPIWAVMIGGAMFAILSAILYFQLFMAMDPCELCVYIRFSQCCIVIAGLIILIDPRNHILKGLGLLLAWYGVIQGFMWSYELMGIHNAAHMVVDESMDFFAAAGDAAGAACSTEPRFPLNLPLDEWLPFEFMPTGGCGEDDWTFLGGGMAHWCMVIYSVFGLAAAPLTAAWLVQLFKRK
ncbi:putative protein-disulfide oxidoreductase DsbI [Shewanella sairae]|uniref:Putative protein-disulfide oxidoreductase DsbI n=1 Tax=Shewanella sairae TaxID=190310 RepID=A0ABQ4PDW3_9GAMM|nr:disulfide bond formation protein B [Shewanella sairae]MCL1129405.1 disulfide bond formation protein B [Shewanella sairae]GIU45572.1 putative protein-disulfide oxidoreductase DsbI [Shewanella sairae]